MRTAGFIGEEQYQRARKSPVKLVKRSESDPLPWHAPHFVEHVRRDVLKRFGRDKVYGAGWDISTTVDLALQKLARLATRRSLSARWTSDKGGADRCGGCATRSSSVAHGPASPSSMTYDASSPTAPT